LGDTGGAWGGGARNPSAGNARAHGGSWRRRASKVKGHVAVSLGPGFLWVLPRGGGIEAPSPSNGVCRARLVGWGWAHGRPPRLASAAVAGRAARGGTGIGGAARRAALRLVRPTSGPGWWGHRPGMAATVAAAAGTTAAATAAAAAAAACARPPAVAATRVDGRRPRPRPRAPAPAARAGRPPGGRPVTRALPAAGDAGAARRRGGRPRCCGAAAPPPPPPPAAWAADRGARGGTAVLVRGWARRPPRLGGPSTRAHARRLGRGRCAAAATSSPARAPSTLRAGAPWSTRWVAAGRRGRPTRAASGAGAAWPAAASARKARRAAARWRWRRRARPTAATVVCDHEQTVACDKTHPVQCTTCGGVQCTRVETPHEPCEKSTTRGCTALHGRRRRWQWWWRRQW